MRVLSAAASLLLSGVSLYSQIQVKGALPGDPTVPPVTGKGSLSGVVINAKTHEPIKKANVSINGPASLSAVTDAGGNFSFRALPAGVYWVMANQADFAARQLRGQMGIQLTEAEGEEKTGVEIALTPGSSIGGRVLNEDDQPVENCSVTATKIVAPQERGGSISVGAATDAEGTYEIHGAVSGRYRIRTQCNQSFPAPHGFMRLNDPEIPTEGYASVSYAGGGTGLLVEAGADLRGIDFHVQRSRMFSVRAGVVGVDPALLPAVQIYITPKDNLQDDDVGMPARYNGRRGVFMFRNVAAGSYEVEASVSHGDRSYQARQDIQVGKSAVADVELRLTPGADISGTVVTDDPSVSLEGQQISLQPLQENFRGSSPMATLTKEGTFEFKSVLPGRFSMNGLQGGFFKTVTLGGREVTPSSIEISGEAAGVLHITLSSRFGKVHVSSETRPAAGQHLTAILLPLDGDQIQSNVSSNGATVDLEFNSVAPGRYHVLLVETDNPWPIAADPALQKALEDHMASVTVAEAAEPRVTAPLVSGEELHKLMDATE